VGAREPYASPPPTPVSSRPRVPSALPSRGGGGGGGQGPARGAVRGLGRGRAGGGGGGGPFSFPQVGGGRGGGGWGVNAPSYCSYFSGHSIEIYVRLNLCLFELLI